MGFFGNKNNTDLILNGIELFSQGRYEEAIQFYDQALAINPNDKDGWNGKGDSLHNLGKYEEAITCYDFAFSVSPDDDTWTAKGSSLIKIKKYEDADFCFVQALAINIQNTTAINMKKINLDMQKHNHFQISIDSAAISLNKAQELFNTKKFEDAIPYYTEALKKYSLIPIDSELFTRSDEEFWKESLNSSLSSCYYLIKKYEKSLTCVDKALLVDPNNVDSLVKKSALLFKLEKYEEALVTITEALKIEPNNQRFWNTKGNCLFNSSKYEEAIICFDKALEIDPGKSMYLSNKGECLDKLSKYPESISYYEKALENDPNNEKVQKNLDVVKAKLSKDSSSKTVEKLEVIEKSEPLDVLKMRLAKGEITLEEFNKIKECLE